MTAFELAQVTIARMLAPFKDPSMQDFVTGLALVNASADVAPGFIWRLQVEDGDMSAVRAFDWDMGDSFGVLPNISVWTSVEALSDFVFSGEHLAYLKRRREWFLPVKDMMTALWWVPSGHQPTVDECVAKVRHLRENGPIPEVFTLRTQFPRPDVAAGPRDGDPDSSVAA
ncbi:DUF3291 domain-containing protein [Amycolatopsis sp. lyj-112]|uniref:DUF3291 domain-containing protein n=1 Tax=Amycolatopsis sp. lyj-112 TaxID=2789288 RepID=UPI00397E24A0